MRMRGHCACSEDLIQLALVEMPEFEAMTEVAGTLAANPGGLPWSDASGKVRFHRRINLNKIYELID